MRVFLMVLMLLLIPVFSACAQPEANPAKPLQIAPSSPAKIVPTASNPEGSMTGITRVAARAGVRTCLERIEQVSSFITAKTQSKFVMFLPSADVNRQITSASLEVEMPAKEVAYASMTTAPTADNSCDALYEAIAYWEKSCSVVAENDFSKAKPLGVIQQKIRVLEVGPTIKVFLMPAGTQGCVSIKKEVVY